MKSTNLFKTFLVLIIVHCSLLINNCFSQWQQIATINTTELRGVKFFDELTGIAVGVGSIWRSTNSGVNWTQVFSSYSFNAVSFIDANSGLVAADNGIILKSTNGGIVWNYTNNVDTANIYAIQWANASICFAVGEAGRLLKSTNSGGAWYFLNSGTNEDLKGVYMADPGNGHIAGGTIHEICAVTTNGGSNWLYELNQAGNYLNSISSPTNFLNIIVVGSNGRIRKSSNFGGTWTIVQSGVSTNLNSVYFIYNLLAYVCGNTGVILKTTNAGSNWNTEPSGTNNNLKSINFINQYTGWAVGQDGIVLRTGIPLNIDPMSSEIPGQFKLYQNFPNPFNPETNISFDIAKEGHVKLSIYDVSGKEISTLVDSFLKPRKYIVKFDGTSYASGIYFCIMSYMNSIVNNFETSIKIILQK